MGSNIIVGDVRSGFSKQVKQKVSERRLAVGALEEEVQYRFSVRALTVGAGAAAEARARTGPQPGSPAPPAALRLRADPAALHLRWTNAASGKGPLLGYYFEARKKGTVPPRARFLHSSTCVRNASRSHL